MSEVADVVEAQAETSPPGRPRALRVLYVHRTRSRDGQAVHIEELIHALRQRGCDVLVVEPPGTSEAAFGAGGDGVGLLRRLMPRAIAELLELGYSAFAYAQIRRSFRQHRPDVIYERYNLLSVAAAVFAKRVGVPHLLEVNAPLYEERSKHGGLSLRRLARWSEAFVWRRADAVFPVTRVLGGYVTRAGVPESRLRVLHNGIKLAEFDPRGPDQRASLGLQNRVVLGFVGFLRDWHGLEAVIDLLGDPAMQHCALLLVGDGPARHGLEARARELGVADRVRFTGLVGRADIPAYLRTMDVALQPAATSYASPLKLFEYMAIGRAIVAPAQPNLTEVLTQETNALLFPPDDRNAMRDAILRLANDAPLRAKLGAGAHDSIVRGGYTWQHNADRVLDVAAGLIRTGRK